MKMQQFEGYNKKEKKNTLLFFFFNGVSTYNVYFWWLCTLSSYQDTNRFLMLIEIESQIFYLMIKDFIN